jgi:hypothetical protein
MVSRIWMLIWEIWRRNRKLVGLVFGLALCGFLFNALFASPDETAAARDRRLTIDVLFMITSILLVFATFNYTEFNPQKQWTGFPYRLFTLPVPTLILVSIPIFLGVAALELVYWHWIKFVFAPADVPRPVWIATLLGSFMVIYQLILWSLAGFKILRLIVLGLIGASFVGIGFLPGFAGADGPAWFSEKSLTFISSALAICAFLAAWICVARQRSGGGFRRNWFLAFVDKLADLLPHRRRLFKSPIQAQFWLEWRRNGYLFPVSVGAALFAVIAPLSWMTRADPELTVWILGWSLAMPLILALPIGKGFSKPDFWSGDLTLPAFTAVRPLATGEIVVVKLKVAAISALLAWSLLLAFLAFWLPNWADLSSLAMIRVAFWMVHGHSVFPQYLMAALFLLLGAFLSWKFLVGGLWIGLSGNKKLFVGSAATYGITLFGVLIGLAFFANHDRAFRAWLRDDPNRLLVIIEAFAAVAVIAKFWLAARSWRFIQAQRTRRFILAWLAATLCMLLLVSLLWAGGTITLALMALFKLWPLDPVRLRNLLILVALLIIPFARLGLARSSLARNRHG